MAKKNNLKMANVLDLLQTSQFTDSAVTNWKYEQIGSLSEATKGMKMQFTNANLKSTNRVTIQIFPESFKDLQEARAAKADIKGLVCTEPLSAIIRDNVVKKVPDNAIFKSLQDLNIQKDKETNRVFLFSAGESTPRTAVAQSSLADIVFTFEDLLGRIA